MHKTEVRIVLQKTVQRKALKVLWFHVITVAGNCIIFTRDVAVISLKTD